MQAVIDFLEKTGWLVNLMAIIGVPGLAFLFGKYVLPLFSNSRIDKFLPRDISQTWQDGTAKEFARIAIVDDQPADFPVSALKGDGYNVTVYKQAPLSKTNELASYDIVFLDMKGVVKDDPENGGLRLIAELRGINPVQKICAVSSKAFDINATEYFRLANDAKKKPLTAQECRDVIGEFLSDLFSETSLREGCSLAMSALSRSDRRRAVAAMRSFTSRHTSVDDLRQHLSALTGGSGLSYLLVNIARVAKHVG